MSTLRAVKPGEKPPVKPVRTVTEAASNGSTRDLLIATRDRIAVAVEDPKTMARDLAALTKRLMDTAREIAALDAREAQEAGEGAEVTDAEFDAEAI